MRAGVTVIENVINPASAPVFLVDREMTIEQWLDEQGIKPAYDVVLAKNGTDDYVLRRDWATVTIQDNDVLVFTPIELLGGGQQGGGSQVLQIVLTVVVIVAAAYTGGAAAAALGPIWGATAAGIAGAVVQAAVMVAGMMVLNAIFAPDEPATDRSNTYSINNQQNLIQIGQALPVLYGRFRFYPYLIATPYTETFNNETWLYLFMIITQGEADVEEVRIEETPIARLHPSIYEYEIYPPGVGPTLFPVAVTYCPSFSNVELRGASKTAYELVDARQNVGSDENTDEENAVLKAAIPTAPWIEPWIGPFVLSPRGVGVSEIALDFSFPAGLYRDHAGMIEKWSTGVCVQLREIGYNDDEPLTWPCFIDPDFFPVEGSGDAFDDGPIVGRGGGPTNSLYNYFYIYFDHHPGFLSKKVEATDTIGDYDRTDYAVHGDGMTWMDADDQNLSGPWEQTQTINLHGLVADENGTVSGIPLSVMEGDLQVIEMQRMGPGADNQIVGLADTSKVYYRAKIAIPTSIDVVNIWQEGVDYAFGEIAGFYHGTMGGYVGDYVQAFRCIVPHTSGQVNKPPGWGKGFVLYSSKNPGGIHAFASGTSYAVGDYTTDAYGTAFYQCIATNPSPSVGPTAPTAATYWTEVMHWQPLTNTADKFDSVADQLYVGSTVATQWKASDTMNIGSGGRNVRYSKWYNYGETTGNDWAYPRVTVGGQNDLDPIGSNGMPIAETEESYATGCQFFGVSYLVHGYLADRSNNSSLSTPVTATIPNATLVFREKRQSAFAQTVKSTVAQITDEVTTIDVYGAKNPPPAGSAFDEVKRVNRKFGRFELRTRHNSIESYQGSAGIYQNVQNSVVLGAVRTYIPERKDYGNITTMAMKLKANYAYNSATKNKINVIATRKLPIYRTSGAVPLMDNGIYTASEYGAGAVVVEFDTEADAAQYEIGQVIEIADITESGVSEITVGGIPAAMIAGKKLLLKKVTNKSFLVMCDKVAKIRSSASSIASYVDSKSGTTITAPSGIFAVGNDGPNNLVGMAIRFPGNGVHGYRYYSSAGAGDIAGFSVYVEHGSARVRVNWVGHGFSVGDDFIFGNIPSSVPSVTGVPFSIWSRRRRERGENLSHYHSDERFQTMQRVGHVVTEVIDDDNFAFTLRTRDTIDAQDVKVSVAGYIPPAVSRFDSLISGGKYYASVNTIPQWSSTTSYGIGALVVYKATGSLVASVYRSLQDSNSNKNPVTQTTWWTPDSQYDAEKHIVSDKYVGGRLRLEPPLYWEKRGTTYARVFAPGEWCRHDPDGNGIRYYRRKIGTDNTINTSSVIVDKNLSTAVTSKEPGYPGSDYWEEVNRISSGPHDWYFDIVAADVANNRYEIAEPASTYTAWTYPHSYAIGSKVSYNGVGYVAKSAVATNITPPNNPTYWKWENSFLEYPDGTSHQAGVKCHAEQKLESTLGETVYERFSIGVPMEFPITANTDDTVTYDGPEVDGGTEFEVVLCGAGVTNDAQATNQTGATIDTGEASGWSRDPMRTRSIAWAFTDVLANETYGMGMPDENIGISDMVDLDKLWNGRGAYAGSDRDSSLPEAWISSGHAYEKFDRVHRNVSGVITLHYCILAHTSSTSKDPADSSGYAYWRPATAGVPDTFNGIFDRQVTTMNALSAILGVGRAAPTIKNGTVVTGVRDDYKVIPRQMFSDRNILPGSLKVSYTAFTEQENDSLSIKFINEKNWQEDDVLAFAADAQNPYYYCEGYLEGSYLSAVPRTWVSTETYRKNEYVSYGGSTYVSLQDDNLNHSTASTSWWSVATSGVFVPENQMDTILWADGKDMTIISYIDEWQVVVSIFDRKGTPTNPEPFTIYKGKHANPTMVEGFGFTVRKQAWREAKWRVDATRARRAKISWTTEMEGLNCAYGDRVIVAGLWGQSGDIVDCYHGTDGYSYLTLDRDLFFKQDGYAYALTSNPITVKRGSNVAIVSTESVHRVQPGTVITISGLSGTAGGITMSTLNGSLVVQTNVDEYSFTVLMNSTATSDAAGGGAGGSFAVDYDAGVLNVALRKKDGSVAGPMAIGFHESPGDPDYFIHLRVETVDLDGFEPVFDTDMERTHYIIGMASDFKRDCKVISATPHEDLVDIVAFDDGDNSQYESDLTYLYTSDVDTTPVPQSTIAPQFEYAIGDDGIPIPVISVRATGTAAKPMVMISWSKAQGASMYRVEESPVGIGPWTQIASTGATWCEVDAVLGGSVTYRVFPVGFGEGFPAYFSGVARFDGNVISFPGQIIRTGANIDIEPLDDTDSTTIAAMENKLERSLVGVKNGYNKSFELPARPIVYDQIEVGFGTPRQVLEYVKTREFRLHVSVGTDGANEGVTRVRFERPDRSGFEGVQVGDRVRIIGAQGVYVSPSLFTPVTYSAGATYPVGAYVQYGSSWWRCIQASTGNTPAENLYWTALNDGDMVISGENLELAGVRWTSGSTYYMGDVVYDAYGNYYRAINTTHVADDLNAPPLTDEWEEILPGYEVVDTYFSAGLPPQEWALTDSYVVGDKVSYYVNSRLTMFECIRPGSGHEPYVDEWELWWSEIDVDDWDSSWGISGLVIEVGHAQFEDGFTQTAGASVRFDGTPDFGEPATTLPQYAFYVVPNQNRVYVFDPGHGFPEGFCDTAVAFVTTDDNYLAYPTVCGIGRDYVLNAASNFDSQTDVVRHNIYVINENLYYFIPTKSDGTKNADIPTIMKTSGDATTIRYKLAKLLSVRPLGPSEFTAYSTSIRLGAAPRFSDSLTVRYAARE